LYLGWFNSASCGCTLWLPTGGAIAIKERSVSPCQWKGEFIKKTKRLCHQVSSLFIHCYSNELKTVINFHTMLQQKYCSYTINY